VLVQTVTSTADSSVFGSQVTVSGLVNGQHLLRVVAVDGTVAIDAFAVEAPPALPPETPTPTLPSATPEAALTALPAATDTLAPTPTSLPPGQSVLTLVADADAQVQQADPTTNYGAQTTLGVHNGATASDSYLRFTVSGVTGAMRSATLRLYVTSSAVDGPAVYLASSDWSESGITWQTQPAHSSTPADDLGALAADTWVELDVTSLVQGNGAYSFALASGSPETISLSSREGSAPPQLVIVWDSSPLSTATPVPTDTPTATPLPTATPSPMPAETSVPTAVPTETPVPVPTPTLALTETPVPTDTPTGTPLPTSAPTDIPAEPPTPVALLADTQPEQRFAARASDSAPTT
jgi:hypothetical protein